MLKVIGLLMRDCYVFRGWGFPQTFQLIDYVWMREYFIKIGINPDATFCPPNPIATTKPRGNEKYDVGINSAEFCIPL